MAVYQPHSDYFVQQLDSIQNQDWRDWVCVVTCDSSLEEIRQRPEMERFFDDSRFVFRENSIRLGHKANFDRAIQLAASFEKVDAIACSDQDDIWLPNKLSVLKSELEKRPAGSLVHSDMALIYSGAAVEAKQGQTLWKIERRNVSNSETRHLLVRSIVNGAAMMFDAHLARRFGAIPSEVGFHDQWYSILASQVGGVYPVHRSLVQYRQHGDNVVGASHFQGRFALPSGGRVRGLAPILRHLKSRWLETRQLVEGLRSKGIDAQTPGVANLLFMCVRHWSSDPVLARASAGRLIGRYVPC